MSELALQYRLLRPELSGRIGWSALKFFGASAYGYIGYISFYREKAWAAIGLAKSQDIPTGTLPIDTSGDNIRRGRKWLLPAKIGVRVGFLCVLLFTLCFVTLGAQVLRPDHLGPAGQDLLTHRASFLRQFHPSLNYLYQLPIFVTFWGTIYGAYEIYLRSAHKFLAPLSERFRNLSSMKTFRLAVVAYCGIGGLCLMWTVSGPVRLVTPAAIMGDVLACGLWCLAMIWTDRRFLPRALRMGPILLSLTTISGVVLTALG